MMRIEPLIQHTALDVADWEVDAEFGVFPQGARAKDAVFAPVPPPEPVLVGEKRYLFKRSKRSYPDQFWGEVIAYRVGCLMGLEVPPAFAAFSSRTGHSELSMGVRNNAKQSIDIFMEEMMTVAEYALDIELSNSLAFGIV